MDFLTKALKDQKPDAGEIIFDKNGHPQVNPAFEQKKPAAKIPDFLRNDDFITLNLEKIP